MPSDPGHKSVNRRQAADAMRAAVLTAAASIITHDGVSGLKARRLSAAVGASTKVIYSHFNGMSGVIAALYDHGFAALTAQLGAAVDTARTDQRFAAIADAYRQFAQQNPDLFDLMFGPSVARLLPTNASRAAARSALNVLVDAYADSDHQTAEERARQYWAAFHGVVMLEHTGWFESDEAERRLSAIIA